MDALLHAGIETDWETKGEIFSLGSNDCLLIAAAPAVRGITIAGRLAWELATKQSPAKTLPAMVVPLAAALPRLQSNQG